MPDLELVFLISLPRSGSTLLQKILAVHPDVASKGEPWLLLPLAFMNRSEGIEAVYFHKAAAQAIRELIGNLPGGEETYRTHLRTFVLSLYRLLAGERRVFVDKDTRYYLILDFLAEVFPTAKFVFLFRNPLDVMSSAITTYRRNRLLTHAYHVDLYDGVRLINQGRKRYASRSIEVHYNRLTQEPQNEVPRICDFLGLDFREEMLTHYKEIDFGGTTGDPTGIYRYQQISTDSIDRWKEVLNSRYRIRFARQYLKAIGDAELEPFGISLSEFEKAIPRQNLRLRGSLTDFVFRHLSDVWRVMSGPRLEEMLLNRGKKEINIFG